MGLDPRSRFMSIEVFVLIFFAMLLLGVPVALTMGMSSALYLVFSGNPLFLRMLPQRMFDGIDVFVLLAIPFFMLAGEIMNAAGMSDRLIRFANLIVGRMRGGLAQVNVVSSLLFAGITGVAVGDVAALGKIFIPRMEREGYDRAFAAAVTAASSLVGPIIPPSAVIVFYAAIMDVSVGAMFAGAIIPGLLVGVASMVVVWGVSEHRQYPRREVRVTPREFALGFKDAGLALVMPILIVGGILFGIFTPTEAAAAAVAYALVVGFLVFRSLRLRDLNRILQTAVLDSSRLMFIIAMAAVINWIFGIEQVPRLVAELFSGLSDNPILVVLAINLFFLVIGFWVEPAISIILFVPVVAPLAFEAGLHPVQFGLMLIVNLMMGLCTPPVGNVLFALSSIVKLDMRELSRELAPFLALIFVVVLAMGFVPALTLWLPRELGLIR